MASRTPRTLPTTRARALRLRGRNTLQLVAKADVSAWETLALRELAVAHFDCWQLRRIVQRQLLIVGQRRYSRSSSPVAGAEQRYAGMDQSASGSLLPHPANPVKRENRRAGSRSWSLEETAVPPRRIEGFASEVSAASRPEGPLPRQHRSGGPLPDRALSAGLVPTAPARRIVAVHSRRATATDRAKPGRHPRAATPGTRTRSSSPGR